MPDLADIILRAAERLAETLKRPVMVITVESLDRRPFDQVKCGTIAATADMTPTVALFMAGQAVKDAIEAFEGSTCACGACGRHLSQLRNARAALMIADFPERFDA
jgi:hypothetical protein